LLIASFDVFPYIVKKLIILDFDDAEGGRGTRTSSTEGVFSLFFENFGDSSGLPL